MERLLSELGRYLPSQVNSAVLGGRVANGRRAITILFSDVKGFTPLVEELNPNELTRLLNSYLEEMVAVASEHGGTIDKFIGDAIMIYFGAPNSQGEVEDAVACVRTALDIQARLVELRADWGAKGMQELHARIGIHSGVCTVGNFGSDRRLEYTAIGHAVNVASRLEGVAEPDTVLVSASTYQLVQQFFDPFRYRSDRMVEQQKKGDELTC